MMKNSIENIIKENKIMVIDGSMSTPLENRGVSLNSKLWTAKILAEQPELIKQVHKNYFKAGADCGITCSYQASIPGLMENGYTLEEAENLIRSAVKIFCEARDEWWEEEGREARRAWPLCLGAADLRNAGNAICIRTNHNLYPGTWSILRTCMLSSDPE